MTKTDICHFFAMVLYTIKDVKQMLNVLKWLNFGVHSLKFDETTRNVTFGTSEWVKEIKLPFLLNI